jgi:Na+/H+-dicarboxylate symporter
MGIGVLVNLGMLVATLYLALIIFVVVVLGTVIYIIKLPLKQYIKAIKEPFTLAFVTTSSESRTSETDGGDGADRCAEADRWIRHSDRI